MMKLTTAYVPVALLLFGVGSMGALCWNHAFAQDGSHANFAALAPRWEYKVIRFQSPGGGVSVDAQQMEADINRLGEDGWECTGTVSDVGRGFNQFNKTDAVLIFKRPRS